MVNECAIKKWAADHDLNESGNDDTMEDDAIMMEQMAGRALGVRKVWKLQMKAREIAIYLNGECIKVNKNWEDKRVSFMFFQFYGLGIDKLVKNVQKGYCFSRLPFFSSTFDSMMCFLS